MKTVIIKELYLRNFKGAKDVRIDFNPISQTTIKGDNGTGKTTIFDAFNFLLWGKNSHNETSFDIKTLDKQGNSSNVEHEVTGVLLVNGTEITLKRIYTEKWTKKRGSETREMTGHDTSFFINDVPKSLAEYKTKVDEIINPSFARMITDPLFFNTQIGWKERREILSQIAGISENEAELIDTIATAKNDLQEVIAILNEGKTLAEKKAEIGAKKSKLKEELNQIPSRLDEVDRQRPAELNWTELESQKSILAKQVTEKKETITNLQNSQQTEFEKVRKSQQEKFDLQKQYDAEKNRIELSLNADRNEAVRNKSIQDQNIKSLNNQKTDLETEKTGKNTQIEALRKSVDLLREQWKALNATPIETSETVQENCPTCGHRLDESKIENAKAKIIEKANKKRQDDLKALEDVAKQKNSEIQNLQGQISGIDFKITQINEQLASTQQIIIPDVKQFVKSELLIELESKIESFIIPQAQTIDVSDLNQSIDALNEQIKEIDLQLANKDKIEASNKRIAELQSQQQTLSQEIANLEKIDLCIDDFNKSKMEIVENRVNNLFQVVKFKMFEKQINGGENQTCVCVVDGVPFNSLNTAMKINAGLDITNTLQSYYATFAPVFIDNRESITQIVPMNCQVVNLVKVEGLTKLEIN